MTSFHLGMDGLLPPVVASVSVPFVGFLLPVTASVGGALDLASVVSLGLPEGVGLVLSLSAFSLRGVLPSDTCCCSL